jgi:hypothetical protein
MEDLQLEIYRLRRENARLRNRLKTTDEFMALHVQRNVVLEHEVKAVNGHFDRSLSLLEKALSDRSGLNATEVFSQAYHLLHSN